METISRQYTRRNYTVLPVPSVISTRLDGGEMAFRTDVDTQSWVVTLEWVVPGDDLETFIAPLKETAPVEIDLVLESWASTEYTCYCWIMPGSLEISTHVSGYDYVVKATVQAVLASFFGD
jgi:hypothetical protein